MSVYLANPLADVRWRDFVETHDGASVFHSVSWLDALRRTYDYRPLVLTTSAPGSPIRDGLPGCELKTWSGRRLVSLPFSDHCDPLFGGDADTDRAELAAYVRDGVASGRWTSAELRPRAMTPSNETAGAFQPSARYWLHRLDLTADLDVLYGRLHASCVRRAIRRAERERLDYASGRSSSLLDAFYRLLLVTRRRHGLPPQPISWFENLIACFGDRLTIRLASKNGRPIAAMLTLSIRKTMVYKYGCSDASEHRLGGMPFLFWRAIQEARLAGFAELDLGRSDLDQSGLIAFKDHLGAARSTLIYYRRPRPTNVPWEGVRRQAAGWVFGRLPDQALTFAGRVLYRHFG